MRLLEAVLLMSLAGTLACLPALAARRLPPRWALAAHRGALLLFLLPLAPLARRLAGLVRALARPKPDIRALVWPSPAASDWWPEALGRLEEALPVIDWACALRLLPWLWLAGVLVSLIRQFRAERRLSLLLRQGSRPLEDPEALARSAALCGELGVRAPIPLWVCAWASTPLLTGLRAPAIYLPGREYAAEELDLVLRHELTHFVRRDLWTKGFAAIACALHWFNPAAHLLAAALDRSVELACDADVAERLPFARRLRYGRIILDAAVAVPAGERGLRAPLGADYRTVKRRIQHMLYPKQNSKRMRFALAVVLLLSLALCVGVSAAAPLSLEVASASAGPSIHVSDAVPAFASPMGDGWPPMTYDGHDGLDYPAPQGTPVYAAAGGTVLYAAPEAESDGYGNVLVIDHGNGYATLYAHCHELFAQAGDRVARGEVIAAVGQTGYSTGNHLHFELRLDGEPLDPAPYLP